MSNGTTTLAAAFDKAAYPLGGHGKRNADVLKEAFREVGGSLVSDMYGKGSLIEDFQQHMAEYLGMESAVFFPSGTMAQQIALRIWSDEAGISRVAYHPLCHLEIHEEHGLRELHHIESVLLADSNRLITLADIQSMHGEISCLLLELPQREIGGELPSFDELAAISAYCRSNQIKLHLDGARLFEITPHYQKSASEICALFDSVYVSFYKGIGGIAGAILAGSSSFTEKSKIWKRRHGGDLISLYPYIVSSDYYFRQRIGKMAQYYDGAKELAHLFNQCTRAVTKPSMPQSNMFHVHFGVSKTVLEPILIDIYETSGVGLIHALRELGEKSCYCEISIGDRYAEAPFALVKAAMDMLDHQLSNMDNVE